MDDLNNLRACPFCDEEGELFVFETGRGTEDYASYVQCRNCTACGPNGEHRQDAIDRWNRAARRQPDAGVVYQYRQKDTGEAWIEGDSNTEARMKSGPAADSFEFRTLYTTPPASPVPASVRAAILEEVKETLKALRDKQGTIGRAIAIDDALAAIRALASKEVQPEPRGDSTDFKGGADAVDGPIGAVLAYDTKGHSRACGQTIGANGAGEFVIIFYGTPEECNEAAYRHIRAMEANGYRFNSVIGVMDGDAYSGPAIRHVDASSRAIDAAIAAQGDKT